MGKTIDFNNEQLRKDIANCDYIESTFVPVQMTSYPNMFTSKDGKHYINDYMDVIDYLNDCGYVSEFIDDDVYEYYKFSEKTGYYESVSASAIFDFFLKESRRSGYRWTIKSTTKSDFMANVSTSLRTIHDLVKTERYENDEEMYLDGEVIPFKNGLYSLRHNRLLPRTSCYFVKRPLHVNFNPDALKDPIGKRYRLICNESELIEEYLFEQLGYAMYARTFLCPTYTFMYGGGSNGKSIIVDKLIRVLGKENISSITLEGMADNHEPAYTEGKIANICADASPGYSENEYSRIRAVPSFMKECSSGEEWMFNPKHKAPHIGKGPSKFVFALNSMPNLGDTSGGTVRRLRAVHLRNYFEQDASVEVLLKSEISTEWFAMRCLTAFMSFIHNKMKGNEDIPGMPLTGAYIKCPEADKVRSDIITSISQVDYFLGEWMGFDVLDIRDTATRLNGFENLYDIYMQYTVEFKIQSRYVLSKRSFHKNIKDKYGVEFRRTMDANRNYVWICEFDNTLTGDKKLREEEAQTEVEE